MTFGGRVAWLCVGVAQASDRPALTQETPVAILPDGGTARTPADESLGATTTFQWLTGVPESRDLGDLFVPPYEPGVKWEWLAGLVPQPVAVALSAEWVARAWGSRRPPDVMGGVWRDILSTDGRGPPEAEAAWFKHLCDGLAFSEFVSDPAAAGDRSAGPTLSHAIDEVRARLVAAELAARARTGRHDSLVTSAMRAVHVTASPSDAGGVGAWLGRTFCRAMGPYVIDGPPSVSGRRGPVLAVWGMRRPVFDPRWRTATAVGLARHVTETREFGVLPLLADALEEAGCDAAAHLDRLRGDPAHHTAADWAVWQALDLAVPAPPAGFWAKEAVGDSSGSGEHNP